MSGALIPLPKYAVTLRGGPYDGREHVRRIGAIEIVVRDGADHVYDALTGEFKETR